MSQGEAIIPYRLAMRIAYICLPQICFIAPDRESGIGPEVLFQGLDGNWIATFSGREDFVIQQLQADHETGHEVIDQLIARGLTKPAIAQSLYTRRNWGLYQSQKNDLDAGVYGAPGTYNYWQNDPNEQLAESVRCAFEGPLGSPGTSSGNPGRTVDWGQTIQHAAELEWWQQIVEDRVIKLFLSGDIPVPLNAQGDTPYPNGQTVPIPAGTLSPGVVSQGFCNRIGFAGTETKIGDATFIVDSSGLSGKLHVRGGQPANGTAWYRVSAEQKI